MFQRLGNTYSPTRDTCLQDRRTHITRNMGFTSRRSHITRGSAFLRLANKPRGYVFAKYESTHHLGYFPSWRTHIIRDLSFPGKETHITRDMCFPGRRTHISRDKCWCVGEHISLGICVSQVGEHLSLGICVS